MDQINIPIAPVNPTPNEFSPTGDPGELYRMQQRQDKRWVDDENARRRSQSENAWRDWNINAPIRAALGLPQAPKPPEVTLVSGDRGGDGELRYVPTATPAYVPPFQSMPVAHFTLEGCVYEVRPDKSVWKAKILGMGPMGPMVGDYEASGKLA